jgi:hypothetical protein
MIEQGDGPLAGLGRCRLGRIIRSQELNQSRRDLLGGAPGPLMLEGVPIAIADRQLALQPLGQGQRILRPLVSAPGVEGGGMGGL